jgi:hypothetical protein
VKEHAHLDGFEHLDLDVATLNHEFHLSWKVDASH